MVVLGRCDASTRALRRKAGRKNASKDGANLALFCDFCGLHRLRGYIAEDPPCGRLGDISGCPLHRESGSEKAFGIEDYLGLFFHFRLIVTSRCPAVSDTPSTLGEGAGVRSAIQQIPRSFGFVSSNRGTRHRCAEILRVEAPLRMTEKRKARPAVGIPPSLGRA